MELNELNTAQKHLLRQTFSPARTSLERDLYGKPSVHGSRAFTRYWHGGSEMTRRKVYKRNIGANSYFGFPI